MVTALLNAEDGRVYLDVEHPRLCIRGSEDRAAAARPLRKRLDKQERDGVVDACCAHIPSGAGVS